MQILLPIYIELGLIADNIYELSLALVDMYCVYIEVD